MEKTFNIVYKITNQVNGKWYIGVHSTESLEDGYMGSGKAIKDAIKRYGPSGFKKEILFNFGTKSEAFLKEKELVSFDIVSSRETYNLCEGGKYGKVLNPIAETHVMTTEGWIPKSDFNPDTHKGPMKGKVIVRDSEGNRFSVSKEDPRYLSGELVSWNKGRTQSEESNLKRSKATKGKPLKEETRNRIKEFYSSKKV